MRDSLEAQDWDQIETWEDYKNVDWDLIYYRLEALDKDELVDWDEVKERREEAWAKIDKKVERADYIDARLDEMSATFANEVDTEQIHQNLHDLKQKDTKVDMDPVKEQLHASAEALTNFDWDDLKEKDGLNWDFIAN